MVHLAKKVPNHYQPGLTDIPVSDRSQEVMSIDEYRFCLHHTVSQPESHQLKEFLLRPHKIDSMFYLSSRED